MVEETQDIAPANVTAEITGPQHISTLSVYNEEMTQAEPIDDWYNVVRCMRKDPTIKIARVLAIAPALVSEWSVEADKGVPEDVVEFIEDNVLHMRRHIVEQSMLGMIDFGWSSFEKVFHRHDDGLELHVKKLKPLLPDKTVILVDEKTGAFKGLRQTGSFTVLEDVDILVPKSLLFSQNVEGTNWYGEGDMITAHAPFTSWNNADAVAKRFDEKSAGSHWVVHFPIGETVIDGITKGNEVVARDLLASLQSNGSIALPKGTRQSMGVAATVSGNKLTTDNDWEIELIEAKSGTSSSMKERQQYIDVLKVRAFAMPERALQEGQHGTKAEAEAHADVALVYVENRHANVRQVVNWHLVNQLIRLNFDKKWENKVRVIATPIGSDEKLFLRGLYLELIKNADVAQFEIDKIDFSAIKELVGVPEDTDVDNDTLLLLRDALKKAQEPDPRLLPAPPAADITPTDDQPKD